MTIQIQCNVFVVSFRFCTDIFVQFYGLAFCCKGCCHSCFFISDFFSNTAICIIDCHCRICNVYDLCIYNCLITSIFTFCYFSKSLSSRCSVCITVDYTFFSLEITTFNHNRITIRINRICSSACRSINATLNSNFNTSLN